MDAAVGDLPSGDVLVDGDAITAVAAITDGDVGPSSSWNRAVNWVNLPVDGGRLLK